METVWRAHSEKAVWRVGKEGKSVYKVSILRKINQWTEEIPSTTSNLRKYMVFASRKSYKIQ